ncbi:zinc finger protein 830 isoform X1 [Bufo gargarizans]|uniref:zinc finger protein 830 isoform X1 n=1 Tax=Bufo gargarizans TaxID=30331 RepID=UPI001CF581F2|nr:zinc finger protein 830 isoform X1 [Bufo gargarizans]
MAASGKKTIIQQDELRRLMKAKQREAAAKKKIESPLAKYNSLGQLSCVVCSTLLKSELLWQAHILGKQHKEKVAELKGTQVKASSPSVSTQLSQTTKRKGPVLESLESKRIKDSEDHSSASSTESTLPPGFFETHNKSSNIQTPRNVSNIRLLAEDYNDDDDEGEEKEDGENVLTVPSCAQQSMDNPPKSQDRSLPPDFFDSKTSVVSHSGSILKADVLEKPVPMKENTAEALPEGFFDDPDVDAKVRKVDAPKDHLDKEWEEFQKEMRKVNTVSEAIMAEEDEEGRLDRQIDEIDEQIECYRRIEHLRNRKEVLHITLMDAVKRKLCKHEEGDIGSDDEDILPTMLTQSWREKGVFL